MQKISPDQLPPQNLDAEKSILGSILIDKDALGKVADFLISPFQESEFEKIEMQSFKPIVVNSIKLFESIPNEGFHNHNTLAEIKLR